MEKQETRGRKTIDPEGKKLTRAQISKRYKYRKLKENGKLQEIISKKERELEFLREVLAEDVF